MPEEIQQQYFLACRHCRAVHPLTVVYPEDGVEMDVRLFVLAHAGHELEVLSCRQPAVSADLPFWDPMATTYVEVSNGRETFVVRSSRDSIDEPQTHTLIPGRLRCRRVDVDIDEELLRRGLYAHFYPHTLPGGRVDRMLGELRRLVYGLDPASFSIVHDDAEDPQLSIARVPHTVQLALQQRCEEIFDGWESPRVREFIARNGDEDGLLIVRVRRTFDLDLSA